MPLRYGMHGNDYGDSVAPRLRERLRDAALWFWVTLTVNRPWFPTRYQTLDQRSKNHSDARVAYSDAVLVHTPTQMVASSHDRLIYSIC